MTATIGEYKGHKTLSLSEEGENSRFPFSFGLSKAKLILKHLEDIQKFVKENE